MYWYGSTSQATQRKNKFNSSVYMPSWWLKMSRFSKVHKCITSKAGILVLLWSFIHSHMYYWLNHIQDLEINSIFKDSNVTIVHYGVKAFVYLLFPIAGYVADNKFGHFKTVTSSLMMMTASFLLICILQVVPQEISLPTKILTATVCLISLVAFICVAANIIQLGVDQLYDSPAEHQSLFIHWHVWFWYLGSFIAKLEMKVSFFESKYFYLTYNLITALFLILSVMLAYIKKLWFLQDAAQLNPYRLVYQVTKFARLRKVPFRRITSNGEREILTGLDVCKSKYGGPFTATQVEDVKMFYGILKVLLVLGFSFTLYIASGTFFPFYRRFQHNHSKTVSSFLQYYLLENRYLSQLTILLFIPLYIYIIRPFFIFRVPPALTRMRIGFTIQVLSIIINFIMTVAFQFRYETDVSCTVYALNSSDIIFIANSTELVIHNYVQGLQGCLNSLSNILVYIALFEFICSQSPHSMKGLLIGLCFALQGLFQFVGIVIILPFYYLLNHLLFKCWVYYFVINIIISIAGLFAFVKVARNYRLRRRDEPFLIYHYAEDHYSKLGE